MKITLGFFFYQFTLLFIHLLFNFFFPCCIQIFGVFQFGHLYSHCSIYQMKWFLSFHSDNDKSICRAYFHQPRKNIFHLNFQKEILIISKRCMRFQYHVLTSLICIPKTRSNFSNFPNISKICWLWSTDSKNINMAFTTINAFIAIE